MIKYALKTVTAAALALSFSGAVLADEQKIGDPVEAGGLKIALVYRPGVAIEPKNDINGPNSADIYLHADIHALKNNPNGLGKGEWIPYLSASYVVTKPGSDFKSAGTLVPMTSVDGPHYGRNINLAGAGKYHVVVTLKPPVTNGFFRHTDKETGVAQWWDPIVQEWDFTYSGNK